MYLGGKEEEDTGIYNHFSYEGLWSVLLSRKCGFSTTGKCGATNPVQGSQGILWGGGISVETRMKRKREALWRFKMCWAKGRTK